MFPLGESSKLVPVHAEDLEELCVPEVLFLLAGVHMLRHVFADQDAVCEAAPGVGVAARDEAIGDNLGLRHPGVSSGLCVDLLHIPLVLLPGSKVATEVWRLEALVRIWIRLKLFSLDLVLVNKCSISSIQHSLF